MRTRGRDWIEEKVLNCYIDDRLLVPLYDQANRSVAWVLAGIARFLLLQRRRDGARVYVRVEQSRGADGG